jgi:glutamate-1-semialdehyde 2,1-aminomutase
MSAGIAGLGQVYTSEAATALNQRGDALRERLNELCREHAAELQFTGFGSLMNLHATSRTIHRIEDLPTDGQPLREAFFFQLLEQGFYIARRGFISLSLPLTDDDLDRFAQTVERVIEQIADQAVARSA